MACIHVLYRDKESDFDYIPGSRLDTMIVRDEISHFYRPSEKRWVSIKFDALRGAGEQSGYKGPERRIDGKHPGLEGEGKRKPAGVEKRASWLEKLWRQIETA